MSQQEQVPVPLQDAHPAPPSTTTWSGILLTAGPALLLANAANLSLPLLETFVIPLSGWGVLLLGRVLLLAAFLVLALGVRDESGAAGTSRLGRFCLVVWGAAALVFMFVGATATTAEDLPALPYVIAVVQLLVGAAAIVAAVAVARAGVLRGWSAWMLLPAALLDAVLTLAQLVPAVFEIVYPALETGYMLQLALLLLAGLTCLLHGRRASLRDRLRAVRDAW